MVLVFHVRLATVGNIEDIQRKPFLQCIRRIMTRFDGTHPVKSWQLLPNIATGCPVQALPGFLRPSMYILSSVNVHVQCTALISSVNVYVQCTTLVSMDHAAVPGASIRWRPSIGHSCYLGDSDWLQTSKLACWGSRYTYTHIETNSNNPLSTEHRYQIVKSQHVQSINWG